MHVFRKTVATRLDDAGLSARQVADQLGHARPSLTQDIYMGRKVVTADAARLLDRERPRTLPGRSDIHVVTGDACISSPTAHGC